MKSNPRIVRLIIVLLLIPFLAYCSSPTPVSISPTASLVAATSAATDAAPSTSVIAGTDLSSLSYIQAFNAMFTTVRQNYAFNGIASKQPDWDALYAKIQPLVAQAEADHDPQAWFLALRDFTLAFKDGNVNLGGGDIQVSLFQSAIAGGYGLALRELDDGRVLVTYLTPGGPAEQAGIQLGAQVTAFNGQPIASAIEATTIWGAPPSLDSILHYQKARYLMRAPVGTKAMIGFINPGGQSQTVTLTAVQERDSFAVTSYFFTYNTQSPPVESKILPSGLGYVRVTSTSDDREQIAVLFESALHDLQAASVPGLIIDLRVVVNLAPASSDPPLGLASFFAREEIHLGQLQFFDAAANRFENKGAPLVISTRGAIYSFPRIAVLVGPGCSGPCEVEAYALSQLPGVTVVGQSPTAGVLSDVTGGQFLLPEKFSLQIPMGRYVLPDGSLLLEGSGVRPTVRVPVDETMALSLEDVVLAAAEEVLK